MFLDIRLWTYHGLVTLNCGRFRFKYDPSWRWCCRLVKIHSLTGNFRGLDLGKIQIGIVK